MKILLSSKSFTTRDCLDRLFKDLFKNSIVITTSSLISLPIIELINYDFIFIEIDDIRSADLGLIWKIKSSSDSVKIMVLDRCKSKEVFEKVVRHSIEGYMTLLSDKSEFVYIIKRVVTGKKVYEADLMKSVIIQDDVFGIDSLTKRELEVLKLVSKGLNNKSIASTLHVTEYTVKKHVSSILSKLNLKNRQEAIIHVNNFT